MIEHLKKNDVIGNIVRYMDLTNSPNIIELQSFDFRKRYSSLPSSFRINITEATTRYRSFDQLDIKGHPVLEGKIAQMIVDTENKRMLYTWPSENFYYSENKNIKIINLNILDVELTKPSAFHHCSHISTELTESGHRKIIEKSSDEKIYLLVCGDKLRVLESEKQFRNLKKLPGMLNYLLEYSRASRKIQFMYDFRLGHEFEIPGLITWVPF